MKKIILFLLISVTGYSQQLLLKNISVPTGSYIVGVASGTNSIGTATATIPVSKVTGALANTTSLTINGTTKSFTSTPNFTTTLQDVVNQSPIISGVLSSSSNGQNYVRLNNDSLIIQNQQTSVFAPVIELTPGALKLNSDNGIVITNNSNNIDINSPSVQWNGNQVATENQLPVITASTNITVSGTTPNYTVSSPSQSLSISGQTISLSANGGSVTIPTQTTGLIGLGSLSATSPLFYNNSTGVFTVQPSSTSQSGVLSSTDWNTFNNKQSALTASTNITINSNTISATTPTLTVVNGTLSGSYPTQTLTIPTSTASSTPTLTNSYIGVGDGSNLLSGSSALTYSSSILKINASKTNTTDVTSNLQVGSLFMGLGDVTQDNQPTFIEMFKGNGSNSARSLKGSMGFLGTTEMNLSINMDYRTGSHKYYDATLPAAWIYLGHTNGFGIQYVPANNPNSAIYATYGCIPFKVSMFNQPSTGKGIDGFSKISFAQAEFTDITNTSTLTATPCTVSLDGGILKTTSITGIETRVTGVSGHLNYQTGTSTGANMKLATGFTTPLGNPSVIGYASGTTTGYNYGGFFEALNGNRNVGVIGKAITGKANTYNIGVLGVATNTNATGPVFAGGFFGLATPDNLTITSAALIADNGSQANDILVLRDNATAVITVADGGNLTSTQNIASSSKTAGIGYAVGSGSTVTQATSRTTGVTINSITGSITLVSAAGSATWQTFTVTNSAVTAKDVIIVNQQTGTDLNMISVTNVAAGSFKISFATTGGTTTEQPVFNFAVIKGQTN